MVVEKKLETTLWPYRKINLGLDLQGGMHLVLQVDTDKAVENTVDRTYDELRSFMRQNDIRVASIKRWTPPHWPSFWMRKKILTNRGG